MLLKLQILFTVISAIFIAAVIPVGTFFGWGIAGACALAALVFFLLMLLCKQTLQIRASKDAPSEPQASENNDEKKENS